MPINWLLPGIVAATLNFSPTMFWLLAGTMLCLAEVAVPTAFTAFMMGVSAFVVALVAVLLPARIALQVGLWMGLSATFVYLTYRFTPKRKVSAIENAIEAQTLTEILPGQTGRVLYEGSSWRAQCGEGTKAIAPHQKVYVLGRFGTTLIVVPERLSDS